MSRRVGKGARRRKLRKRRNRMQTSLALTFQPLPSSSHSTKAPTASGSDSSILMAERFRTPYGAGTGSAITAGRFFSSDRSGDNCT